MQRLSLLGAASAAVLCFAAQSPVLAQNAPAVPSSPAAAAPAGTEVEALVVTGSRVARSRLETIAPVDVISTQQLARQGSVELAQQLNTLAPSVDFPRPAITDGTDSVRPATLRGLAPDQVLVLVDSKRRHASALVNVNGSIGRGSAAVDLNTIPSVAVDRIEILRDGASAQYGSDAIAGVINLHLREASDGGGASVTYGNYNTDFTTARQPQGRHREDGPTYSVSGWQGFKLFGDGFLTLSGEYQKRNATNRSDLDPRVSPSIVTARYGDPEVEQETFYANAGKPLANGWAAYGWLGYQHRDTDSAANPRLATNANNVASLFPSGFLPLITTDIDDYTGGAGVKGPWAGFNVDASVTYGKNQVHYGVVNSVNGSLGAASPTTFDAGIMTYDQLVGNLDFTRPILPGLFVKPVNLAFGAEVRRESYGIAAGDLASYTFGGLAGKAAGAQGFPGFKPANAVGVDRVSGSLYADLEAQVTDKLDVDLAGRFEDYSDFGSTATGKLSARYDFTDFFALRGTLETGFRAPSLQQQYFTATSTNFIAVNGISTPVEVGTFPATSATAAALGGKPLQPEESNNYSVGAVFHTGGFELTLDAYQIDISNRIVLSENVQGSPTGTPTQRAIYALINPPGGGGALGAARFFINGVETKTQGIDAVARYRWATDFGRFELTGAANLNHTDVTKIPTTAQLSSLPVPPILFDRGNRLTFEKGTPQQKFVFSADWKLRQFGATVSATKYGSVLIPGATFANANLDYRSGSHTLVNLEARYTFPRDITLALGADNLFDEYPNQTPTIVNTNGPIGFPSFSPFGFNGRFVYVRLSANW